MSASGNPRYGAVVKAPYILAQGGVSIGKAPTGTMAANGAVTLGTALNITYSDGLWLYYPAGAVYAGSVAGFYWTVMSSTTLGTVYDTTYVPGTNSFDIPSSPTPIVAAGPGAFTGVTSEMTAVSVTLPGGSLGKHGGFKVGYLSWNNSSGTNKTISVLLSTALMGYHSANTNTALRIEDLVRNEGSEAKQQGVGWATFGSSGVGTGYLGTIDTSATNPVIVTLTSATATDWEILDNFEIEVLPS